MTRLVDSELFKLRTTRTFYGLSLISLGLILVIVDPRSLAHGLRARRRGADGHARRSASSCRRSRSLLGVLIVTSEFRHGTITPSLLVVPDRTS